jgi:hypothetical protein
MAAMEGIAHRQIASTPTTNLEKGFIGLFTVWFIAANHTVIRITF